MTIPPAIAETVADLARYLCTHPDASDSSAGIAMWWLQSDEGVSARTVEDALAWLVNCGALQTIAAADGRVHYRMSHEAGARQRMDQLAGAA